MCFMALPCFHETMSEEYRFFRAPAQASTAGGEMSQLRAEKPQRVLPQLLGPGAVLPRFQRDALGALEVIFEDARLRERERSVVNVQIRLVVHAEGARIEVGGSHRDPQLVDDHYLAVKERGLVLVELDAGSEELAPRRA